MGSLVVGVKINSLIKFTKVKKNVTKYNEDTGEPYTKSITTTTATLGKVSVDCKNLADFSLGWNEQDTGDFSEIFPEYDPECPEIFSVGWDSDEYCMALNIEDSNIYDGIQEIDLNYVIKKAEQFKQYFKEKFGLDSDPKLYLVE